MLPDHTKVSAMSESNFELESFIQAITDQPSLEEARQVLVENSGRITEDFLEALAAIGKNTGRTGDVDGALSIFAIGLVAAQLSGNALSNVRFLELLGLAEQAAERTEAAIERFLETFDQAKALVDAGEQRAVRALVRATVELIDVTAEHNGFDAARQLLSETRRRCREVGSLSGEMWINLNLAAVCLRQGDFAVAHDYAGLVVQSFRDVQEGASADFELPDKVATGSMLVQLASAFYYDLEDFEHAASAASSTIELDPQQKQGYFLLGLAQLRLNQFEAAVQTWERAIVQDPTQASYYMNYAGVLIELDRLREALRAASRALEIRPDEPRYYLARGQIHQRLNQHAEAVADFTQTLRLCEHATDEAAPPADTWRSSIEYDRHMPARDMADFARIARIRSYQALGQIDTALKESEFLIQYGDDVAATTGYLLRAEHHETLGQYPEAVASYSGAIRQSPDHTEAHQRRADAYLTQGLFDKAIPDLAFLAHRDQDPEAAIMRLSKILEERPEHALARKWRGYAYQEAWRPSKAEQDLTSALQSLPADPEMYLWRGLARITYSPDPEEEYWNNSLTLKRLAEAIDDLGSAIQLDPDNEVALAAFRWLVDRASADEKIFHWLLVEGDRENGIFNVIPDAREPIARFDRAFDLSERRKWSEATNEWRTIQNGLTAAGLPVWAARIDLHIADNYLRLYELQLALDHLAEAEKVPFLTGLPLSPHLMPDIETLKQQLWQKSGQQLLAPEVDYLGVYGVGFQAFDRQLKLLKAQAFARVGDYAQALSALGDEMQLISDSDPEKSVGWNSFRQLIPIVAILRDAGEYVRALEFAFELQSQVTDERESMLLLHACGTVCEAVGVNDHALQYFQQAHALAVRLRSEFRIHIEMNLAGNYFRRDRLKEAMQILGPIEIAQQARSEHDQYVYYVLFAQVLQALERHADAQGAVLQALSIAEGTRGTLRFYDDRISWHANQEVVHDMAVHIALANDDRRTSFDLTEQSRSRTFVDQLATGQLPLPASAQQLQEIEKTLLVKREVLLRLTDTVKVFGPAFIDYELVHELAALDEDANVLEQADDGAWLLSVTKLTNQVAEADDSLMRLRQQIEEARLASNAATSGSTLSFDELRQLLTA